MAYTARRTRQRTRSAELSGHDRHFLLCGWSLKNNQNLPLPNARELWEQYREELLTYWRQPPEGWEPPGSVWHWPKPAGPGSLPWAAVAFGDDAGS